MSIARAIIAALFIAMAVSIVMRYATVRRIGLLLGAAAYGGAGVLAIAFGAWWPLLGGFALAWFLRRLGADPPTDLRFDLPTIERAEVLDDRRLHEYLNWWLSNDTQARLVTAPFVAEAWQAGFRKPSSVPHDVSWEAPTPEEAWINVTARDIRFHATTSREHFRDHLDRIHELSTPTIMSAGELAVRHNLPTVPADFGLVMSTIPSPGERKRYAENYVADALLAARLRVLAWTYQHWHGERYALPHKRAGA